MQTNKKTHKMAPPSDGLKGLLENIKTDAMSGFLVFLLALPLSLGIAKASEFPAIMGLMTAMIGGVIVSWFSGSRLTIKGPAAGLIVIVAGSVAEFGQGDPILGWHLALGALLIAGILQIIFGFIKMGSLVDFFPLSAIHGMLAAIGIIIMSKQLHLVFGSAPLDKMGKSLLEPVDLILALPKSILNMNGNVAIIGIIS
jgi:MFS superfamily sulfate permease-like transporter